MNVFVCEILRQLFPTTLNDYLQQAKIHSGTLFSNKANQMKGSYLPETGHKLHVEPVKLQNNTSSNKQAYAQAKLNCDYTCTTACWVK